MTNIYEKYASLVKLIDQLEEEKDELKLELMDEIETKKTFDFGTFTKRQVKKWKYTKKIKALEEKVAIAKDHEQRKGLPKAEISFSLVFRPKVEGDDADFSGASDEIGLTTGEGR